MSNKKIGISSIGLHIPANFIKVEELAKLRQVDPNKYTIGLGCKNIALCPDNYGVVDLAAEAAKRALSRWRDEKDRIGLIAVGTESATDMSRPLSAFVAEHLNLSGPIRSYEVKHACYGGTVAVRQALEWKLSADGRDKAALVIAADISLYSPGDPGEPTQGAGAIAMIIDDPFIAEINEVSYPWSLPAYDFWRPITHQFPLVEGELSLECYKQAVRECFDALIKNKNKSFEDMLNTYNNLCFHTPFPKMVKKAFYDICKTYGLSEEKTEEYYMEKVNPTMEWNRLSGNSYTASLWIAVAKTLCDLHPGDEITAFSYGSGCGAELLTLKGGPLVSEASWAEDIKNDIEHQKEIDGKTYEEIRRQGLIHK